MHTQIFLLCMLIKSLVSAEIQDPEAGAHDAQETVKGVLGHSAILPCHVDQDNCGDVYFITWTKHERDDRWSRIYLYANDVEKPLRDLSGRARFSIQRNEAQLAINQLKYADESLYKCDVTYVAGKCPSLTFVQLKIIAKPSKVSIEYGNSHIENGSEINAVENDQLRLTCIVSGGKPSPILSWRRIDKNGERKIIETKNATQNGDETKIIMINQLNRDDLGSVYECHVEHDAIRNDSMDSNVLLNLSVGAQSMEIVGPQSEIKDGDVVIMQCIAYSSKPEMQIIWKNGSEVIDANVRGEIERNADSTVTTRSFLQLHVSRFDHLTTIECRAINIAMKQPLTQSIELRIQHAPIVVMEPKNGLSVNESTDMVNIYCTFSSNPSELIENATLWYKNGKELTILNDSAHYITSLSGYPILTIVNPNRNDSGNYHCVLSNPIGRGIPDMGVQLSVLYPPSVTLQIYPNPTHGFTIKETDDVRMICEITDGNPLNVTRVRWTKNDGESWNETSEKEIVWLNVDRSITGNYSCRALSEAGWSEASNNVEIDVNYLPGNAFVRQLNAMYAIKNENVTLECVVQELGHPNAHEYIWEHDNVPLDNERHAILHIRHIRLNSRGNISCAAVNSVGIGAKGMFQIIPLMPPQIIDSLPTTSGTVFNATEYSLSCRVECYPICNVSWFKNDEIIDNLSPYYYVKNTLHPEQFLLNRFESVVSTLIWNMSALAPLDRTRDSDSMYSCVSSENLVGPSVATHTKFFVEYPPENLRLRPRRVDVIENDIPPEIYCDSDALPIATYRWQSSSYWDKFVVDVIADTQLLSLNRSIERDRSGTYTCIASNRHGESRTDLLINVLYSPSCVIYESRTENGNDIILICEVTSANPLSDLIFEWNLNNYTLNDSVSDQILTQDGVKSKIVIPITNDKLFGTWTCSVRNKVGQTDPNCTLYVSEPLVSDWTHSWTQLDSDSVLLISIIITALIITFMVILLVLICYMRQRRHKQEVNHVSQTRENPDGSRSPTPSSISSQLPSNQSAVITYKKVELNSKLKRNDKVIDASKPQTKSARKLNDKDPALGENGNREMYENMPFHRKKCMILSGAFRIPQYENIAQITKELRRTQSARYTNQPFGLDSDELLYADMYDDVKSGRIPDPRIKPPLPPKGGTSKPPKIPPKTKKS